MGGVGVEDVVEGGEGGRLRGEGQAWRMRDKYLLNVQMNFDKSRMMHHLGANETGPSSWPTQISAMFYQNRPRSGGSLKVV